MQKLSSESTLDRNKIRRWFGRQRSISHKFGMSFFRYYYIIIIYICSVIYYILGLAIPPAPPKPKRVNLNYIRNMSEKEGKTFFKKFIKKY